MRHALRDASRLSIAAVGMLALLALAACSGGESGGGGAASVATPITGTFVDSPVNGLHYTSVPSNPAGGVTAHGGQYQCVPGDTVTFDLGGRVIGTPQPCGELVTVVSVFGATSVTDLRVRNLAQLLLTLGGIPAGQNPIELPATIPANLPAHLNFADPQFEQMLQTTLSGLPLVSQAQALTHLRASFTTLTVTAVNGGQITSIPAGLACTTGTCSYDFVRGTPVTLAAIGTGFTGWNGDGCTGAGTCQILLTATQAIRAVFLAVPPPATLTINPNPGTGTGQVQCSTGGAFGPCAATYSSGTSLTLRGVANSGSTFAGWSNGTGNISCTGTADCSITVTADSSVTATFTLVTTNFSVTATSATTNGGGGTVQCSVNGGEPGPCGSSPVGSTIVMTATPNAVSNFTGWTGAGCTGTGTCTFTLTANTAVTAHFNRPVLTVTVVGTGTVSSSPTGITNCATSCTASFDKGTAITLTASGAGFTGWSGDGCSGTGTCVLNNIQANTSVTATFGAVSSATHYLFVWAVGGALMAIDPAAPTATPITVVASGIQRTGNAVSATYNSGSQTFTNVQDLIVTFAQGGRLWRVNKAKSAGIPGSAGNPVIQITNEIGATTLCNYNIMQTGSPTTARIIYNSAGADADCSTGTDNVSKLAPVLANASTPPFTLPAGTHATGGQSMMWNFTTGQPVALFVTDDLNASTLKRLDLATNAITTIQANVGTVEFVAQDTSDRVFLRNNNQLFLYRLSTNTLTPLLTTATVLHGTADIPGDGANLFVWEESGRVYRVPMTATAPADVVTLISTPITGLYQLAMTNTRLILATASGQQYGLASIPKTGGSPVTLVPLRDGFMNIRGTAGNFVYCNLFSPTTMGDTTAAVIPDDGTPVTTFALSAWSGEVRGDSYSPRIGDSPLSHIIRSVFGPSLANPHNGSTVTVHNAITPLAAQVVLGIQPTDSPNSTFTEFRGSGSSTALIGRSFSMVSGEGWVLFADRTQAGSLALVPLPTAEWVAE